MKSSQSKKICNILATDPGASLQGYSWKKLYYAYGGVFFYVMPLKQGAVLGPDNRDLMQRDNTNIISVYQIPIIRATPVHL